jgi:iron complex transport system substrate-binding protein
MALASLAVVITLSTSFSHASEPAKPVRIVILAPAAVDIIYQLGLSESVVGVTAAVAEFPEAMRVGTHINPVLEKIAALRPTLIIATSRFSKENAARVKAELFIYEPKSLQDILKACAELADMLSVDAKPLIAELNGILTQVKPLTTPLTVLYEVRSNPLSLAKHDSFIKSMLEAAGMTYAQKITASTISAEYLLTHQPDYYIYQEGPMNVNPTPPSKRSGWARLKSCVWRVDELDFARANTKSFQTVLELNQRLHSDTACREGA